MRYTSCKAGLWALVVAIFVPVAAIAQDGYERMATICASPLFNSAEEAMAGYTDTAVMLRNEKAYQSLGVWVSTNLDIEEIRTQVYAHLLNCNLTLAEIRRRDASVPDFGVIASKGLNALPALDKERRDGAGNLRPDDQKAVDELLSAAIVASGRWLWDQYKASEERDNYKAYNREVRRSARALRMVASSHCKAGRPMVYGIGIVRGEELTVGVPIVEVRDESPAKAAGLVVGDVIVAVNGTSVTAQNSQEMMVAIAGPKDSTVKLTLRRNDSNRDVLVPRSMAVYEAALLSVDINGSWNGFIDSDWVFLTNISGRELTNVTLCVDLKGRHGTKGLPESDTHLHYVDRWPAGARKIARYMSTAASGITYDESVDQIDTLTYDLYSNEYRQENTIQYTGEDYDADVKRYCETISLLGSWSMQEPDDRMFNSGFMLTNGENGYHFPCSHVSVAGFWGSTRIAYRWTMVDQMFPRGTTPIRLFARDRYFEASGFNRGRPDQVEVLLEFPYSSYKHKTVWKLSN